MGMLYYECKKCKGCIAIMGNFVGFVLCENCKRWIQEDKDPMFKKHNVQCYDCKFKVSYQSMDEAPDARCVKCDRRMP